MLYKDFVALVSQKTQLPPDKMGMILDLISQTITSTLKQGQKIDLGQFGTFELVKDNQGKAQINLVNQELSVLRQPSESQQPSQEQAPNAQATQINTVPTQSTQANIGSLNSIPYIDLKNKTIAKDILKLVPEHIAKEFQAVPVELADNKLVIAMVDPEDYSAIEILKKTTGFEIVPNICTRIDISHVLDQYSAIKEEIAEIVGEKKPTRPKKTIEKPAYELSEAAPASKIVSSLIKRAVRERASDIHIEPSENSLEIRYRIDGVLHKILALPKEIQPAMVSRIKILCNMKIDEQRLPQDGRFQTGVEGNEIDFRVSSFPTVNGEKIVMRLLDKSSSILTLEQLGLRGKAFEILDASIKRPHGMILITGPTGSGKTTTLYAIINTLRSDEINIVTLEDPVEYRIDGINQSQINPEINYQFANGLRTILRQDPNVIMLGEIRDKETAEMAVQSALTGHIVLSTLHTNDASGALPRLIDMSIEPFLINSSLNLVVAQRLCRKICESCRQDVAIEPQQIEDIKKQLGIINLPANQKLFKGIGCDTCNQTGYKGRIGIFEVLPITEEIKDDIGENISASKINDIAIKQGMVPLIMDGMNKVVSGETTLEEVWRVTRE